MYSFSTYVTAFMNCEVDLSTKVVLVLFEDVVFILGEENEPVGCTIT